MIHGKPTTILIDAASAAKKSKAALEARGLEIQANLAKVVNAAIEQGSCVTNYYPRNAFESEYALNILASLGFVASLSQAKDQRDSDYIQIRWG